MSHCLPGSTEIALRASAVLWLLTGTVAPMAQGWGTGNGCYQEEGEQMLSFLPGHGVMDPPGLTPTPPAQSQMSPQGLCCHDFGTQQVLAGTLRILGEGWRALNHPPPPCPAHTACTASAALCHLFAKHLLVLPAPWQCVQC